MKIKLIAPARKIEWGESFWDLRTLCRFTGRRAGGAPLALPTLAALTPSGTEVVLTDENVEPIDFKEDVDLVGITGMTCVIPRSYEIADEFRRRGIPVVMGGIHVSMLPDEAIQHCDAVVVGEAEEIWEQVVEDARNKTLQRFYRASRLPDLSKSPAPRWDLLRNDKYCYFTVQTGRGCPYDCEFCSVKVFNGREHRHKDVEAVVAEIRNLLAIDAKKWIFFNDDNILADTGYAIRLFEALKPLKINVWWCQSSLNKLSDDDTLESMYKSGCRVIFVGFESITESGLQYFNKKAVNKLERYREIIDKVHSHGIGIFGSFVLGGDNDQISIFDDTLGFINSSHIAFAMINIMAPLPGTKLMHDLNDSKRIFNNEWSKYSGEFVTFHPRLMTKENLQSGHDDIVKRMYSLGTLYDRLHALWGKKVFVRNREGKMNFLSRGRLMLTAQAFFCRDPSLRSFLLKSLWDKNGSSITSVILAAGFHDYAERLNHTF